MRKIDYSILARLIREDIAHHKQSGNHEALARLTQLARNFAASASVNKAEFLQACGIDTA